MTAPFMSIVANVSIADAVRAEPFEVTIEPDFDFGSEAYRLVFDRSRATVFQSPRWLEAMRVDLAPALGVEPATVTVREAGGRLLLVLPLTRRRERGVTILGFADFGLCDYHAAVYDPGDLPRLLADTGLSRRIAATLPKHDVLAFEKLTGDDVLLDCLFPGLWRAPMRQSAYPARLGQDFEEWRASTFADGFRRDINMRRRRLNRTGLSQFLQLRDADAIGAAFEKLRAYRSIRLKAIGAPDVMDDDAVFAFYRRMAIEGARDGFARTEALYLSGEPIAVQFGLVWRGVYSMLLLGADIERHARLSPGLLTIESSLRAAIEAGDHVYDFTIGDHPYKTQFGGQAIPLYEWHGSNTHLGRTSLLALTLMRETKRVLRPLFRRLKGRPARTTASKVP
jgi:CelD/BcsL family acetyltransferase involved in cellulose biosynthesis